MKTRALYLSVVVTLAVLSWGGDVASANAINDTGAKIQSDILDPAKTVFYALGATLAVTVLAVAAIMAALQNKAWRQVLKGGLTCAAVLAFAPLCIAVITGLAAK